jgi:ABC-2 type transport system ATP-binding protein
VAVADPAQIDDAARILEGRLGGAAQHNVEGLQLSIMAETPAAATEALSALQADGIALTDFALGSPSLDEVFFALTGEPHDSGSEEEDNHE